ncbi:MAG: hypothetical protein Q7S50_04335 [bacterium]|nr:hypothetical protein [bacterium]
MRCFVLVALAALAIVWTAPAKADDDLGKRLLVVASTDCGPGPGSLYNSGTAACNVAKTMAFTAYGQRIILLNQCTASGIWMTRCEKNRTKFDEAIEARLFGKKADTASR